MKRTAALLIAVFLLPILLLTGCKCPSCVKQEEAIIPHALLEKANKHIIDRTGEDFFDDNIQPDFSRIKHVPPYYLVVYHMTMENKPYVNAFMNITIDENTGALAPDRDVVGVPDCKSGECKFDISDSMAVKIAKEQGLPEGIKPWKKGFIWSDKFKQYVWDILCTTEGGESSEGFRGKGREIVIDANSGLMLEMNDWRIN